MEGFDLAGFSGQAERLGRDLQEFCGVAKVAPLPLYGPQRPPLRLMPFCDVRRGSEKVRLLG
jgi:hypothetical protein